MNKTYEIIPKIPQYKLFRKFNYPKILPLNLTVSVTYRCNSRCKTCNVWKKKVDEFTIEEYDRTFKSIGKSPYWITISGGEPFIREDIDQICRSVYDHIKPGIINIPTNGIKYDLIPKKVEEIVETCKDSQIIINLSIDGIGEKHDEIRNVKDNFKKALKTYDALRAMDYPNFSLGIHTVISKYNVRNVPSIYDYFKDKHPDSHISEIAEERVELDTIGAGITPSLDDYTESIDYLIGMIKQEHHEGFSKVTQAFRLRYYDHVKESIRIKKQIIPCYAGFASTQISPDGDVWACCIKAEPLGNLRDVDYDFKKVWFSDKAHEIRKETKKGECYCPLANAHYTNMLCDYKTLSKVGVRMII